VKPAAPVAHIKVKQHLASSDPRKERKVIYHYFSRILLVALFGGCYETALDRDRFVLEAHLPNEFLQVSSLDHVDSSEIFGDKFPDHHRHQHHRKPKKVQNRPLRISKVPACSKRMSLSSSPCASQDMAVTERTACRDRPNSLAESSTEIHRLITEAMVHRSTGGPLGPWGFEFGHGLHGSQSKLGKKNKTKRREKAVAIERPRNVLNGPRNHKNANGDLRRDSQSTMQCVKPNNKSSTTLPEMGAPMKVGLLYVYYGLYHCGLLGHYQSSTIPTRSRNAHLSASLKQSK